ncbi:MAG: TonB-dependent siderophore receptor [Pseudomonadota bacterium]
MTPLLRATGAVALCASTTNVAIAQDQAQTQQAENSQLEEILVYGRQVGYYNSEASSALRQDAPILETPVSVFLINSELIADQQSFRLDQILQNDASVQKSNNFLGAYSSYQVRGFTLSNSSNYLRDGRPFFQLASVPTEILERVEVLKGPSSILYGTVTPAGLINMVTKRPSEEFTGFVKGTWGSDELAHYHIDVGGSLNSEGTVRGRLNVINERSESFREFFSGEAFEVEREIYAAAIDWDITERTTLMIDGDYTEDDRPQDIGVIMEDNEIVPALDYDTIWSQNWSQYDSEVSNVSARLDHRFSGDWGIKAIVHHQQFQRDRYDNLGVNFNGETGDNIIFVRRRLNRRDYTSYSLDLDGQFTTGSLVHNLLIGAEQTDIETDDRENPTQESIRSNVFGPAAPDPMIPIGNLRFSFDETRKGLFVQDMIEVGDQWRVLLGLRYDDFDTEFGVEPYSDDNVTPRLGALYLPRENLSVYASYSESFEPNGPVGGEFENAGEELDPTVGEGYEIGAKWELYDGNLLLTGAVFSIDRDGSLLLEPSTNIITQRGQQKHEGVELSAQGLIGNNLSLVSSMTYLDAEFVRDDNPELEGNAPAGVSEWSFSLWAEYQFDTEWGRGLSLSAGVFHESDRPVNDANTFDLDEYTRFDIGAKYAFDLANGHGIIARLTISNVTDEEYFKGSDPRAINPERPREIRGSIQYSF